MRGFKSVFVSSKHKIKCFLTLTRFPRFAIFASGGGGGGLVRPPSRSAPAGRRASRKKIVEASRRDLAITHIIFSPRSTFDLVNPRPAGVFSRTHPAGGGGGHIRPPLPNSRTNRRSEAGEAAIESSEREDSNAH